MWSNILSNWSFVHSYEKNSWIETASNIAIFKLSEDYEGTDIISWIKWAVMKIMSIFEKR